MAACFAPKWAALVTGKLPSAIPSFFPCFRAKAKIFREGKFLRDRNTQANQPHHPEKWEGQFPKGEAPWPSRPEGGQVFGQTRAVCGELCCCFITVVCTGHQRRHCSLRGSRASCCHGAFALCLSPSVELPCCMGHGAAGTFYSRTSVHAVRMPLMPLPLEMVTMIHFICAFYHC